MWGDVGRCRDDLELRRKVEILEIDLTASHHISLHLPASACISLVSRWRSLRLRSYISPHLATPPHISLHLPTSP